MMLKSSLAVIAAMAALCSAVLAQDKTGNVTGDDMKSALKQLGGTELSATAEGSSDTKIAALEDDTKLALATASGVPALEGDLAQGGLVFGKTKPGAQVTLDGRDVMVDGEGRFVLGFHRDHPETANLKITGPGVNYETVLEITDRDFDIQRIDGLDQSKVSGFTPEQLEQIRIGTEKKRKAREARSAETYWADGFDWPVTGRISGVFGSQRILNGEAKRPHSGLDVAAPTGTPIKAPASGIVRLAETDLYFEGGTVFIDHGHELESAILHMSRVDVEVGQTVQKGDVIGAVGATGRATGPHVHWSLKWQDRLVDPRLVLGEMP